MRPTGWVVYGWHWRRNVPQHRHENRRRPSQNSGIAHVRGQVRRDRDGRYSVSVVNTRTGEVLNSDSPFCCLAEAVTEAAWRTEAVRQAWSMSLLKKGAGR